MLHEDRPFHDGSWQNWSAKPSRETPFHFLDGVSLYLSETDDRPDDDFLGVSVAQESPDDEDEAGDQRAD